MPFRIGSILAASDLSEVSREVVGTAAAFAGLTEAALHLVHVPDPAPDAGEGERLRRELRRQIPPGASVASIHLAAGGPADAILARAPEVRADLIVMGPHRPRPSGGRDLGSTADRVVRESTAPCLVVQGPVSLPLRRILVPSDLSPAASGALDVALTWGAALRTPSSRGGDTEIVLLHVAAEGTGAEDLSRCVETLAREIVSARRRTGIGSLLRVRSLVTTGEAPDDEILDLAGEHRADLVVMGTHAGEDGPRGTLGSVSSAVARRTPFPLLLVPPPLWQAKQREEALLERGPR
jgi:universal stress protein E